MKMAKVNPLMAKYCVDFTFANLSPHLVATKKAKSFHLMPYFLLVSYISLYLKGTEIAKVKSELENFT